MKPALELDALSKAFGGVHAVENVSIVVERGEILGLIGPNGSGKTSLLNLVAGTLKPSAGRVLLEGTDVTRLSPHRKVRFGIARTFQSTRLLRDWTVRRTLELASKSRKGAKGVNEIADVVGLAADLDRLTSELPSAMQRLVMVASALASNPTLLLLDEPAVGMDPDEADHLRDIIRFAKSEMNTSVIVVEHNMRFLMPLADSMVVMASGSVLATGSPQEVRQDPKVIAAYLGD